jgi:RHS repeat-associated protein
VDQILADEQVATGSPNDVRWPVTDWQGTVRDVATYNAATNVTTIANHKVYEAFGKVYSESGPTVDTIFGYTGRYFDDDTGLQWNLNRWYDPNVGRWISEDPADFEAGDPNLYRYVRNSPGSYIDSDGLANRKVGEYEVKGTGHHVIPVELWEEFGFDPDTYEFLDNYRRIEALDNAHNYLGHGKKTGYTAFLQAELRERLAGHLKCNESKTLSVIEQQAFIKQFIDDVHSGKVKRKYIHYFNEAAKNGTKGVKVWLKEYRKYYPAYADSVAPIAIRGLRAIPASKVSKLLCFLGNSADFAGKKFLPFVGAVVVYNEARANGSNRAEAAFIAGLEEINPVPVGYSEIHAAGEAYAEAVDWAIESNVHGPAGRFEFDERGHVIIPPRHLP